MDLMDRGERLEECRKRRRSGRRLESPVSPPRISPESPSANSSRDSFLDISPDISRQLDRAEALMAELDWLFEDMKRKVKTKSDYRAVEVKSEKMLELKKTFSRMKNMNSSLRRSVERDRYCERFKRFEEENMKEESEEMEATLIVENMRFVLKSEEDVYNYFIRFGPITGISDGYGNEMADNIQPNQEICVKFEDVDSVERAIKWTHEVVRVTRKGSGSSGGGGRLDIGRDNCITETKTGIFDRNCRERVKSEEKRNQTGAGSMRNQSKDIDDENSGERRRINNKPSISAKEWSKDFKENERQQLNKQREDQKQMKVVQSRLLALVNQPTSDDCEVICDSDVSGVKNVVPRRSRRSITRDKDTVVIIDDDDDDDNAGISNRRLGQEIIASSSRKEHLKEKAEYQELMKKYNIRIPAPPPERPPSSRHERQVPSRHDVIELGDSD